MNTGRVGNVAGDAMLCRHVKHLATGTQNQTAAIGSKTAAAQVVTHLALLLAGKIVLAVEINGDFLATLGRWVEHIEIAAILEDDLAAATVGELHIILGEIGHLLCSTSSGVIHKDVHAVVTVAHEIDLVANPHGINVLSDVVSDVCHRFGLGVIDPDIIGHTALVVLPSAELTEDAVISQFGAVGIVAAETTLGQRQFLGHTAIHRGFPQFAVKALTDAVTVDDAASVRSPCHGDVVGTHAVAPIITRVAGGESDTFRLASLSGHDIDLGVAVILSGERDGAAVG